MSPSTARLRSTRTDSEPSGLPSRPARSLQCMSNYVCEVNATAMVLAHRSRVVRSDATYCSRMLSALLVNRGWASRVSAVVLNERQRAYQLAMFSVDQELEAEIRPLPARSRSTARRGSSHRGIGRRVRQNRLDEYHPMA